MTDLKDTPADIALDIIRDLLESENKWCKHSAAKDLNNSAVDVHDESAAKWCIEGACYKFGLYLNLCVKYLHQASESLYNMELITVNDKLGHAAIINVIDEAILIANEIKSPPTLH